MLIHYVMSYPIHQYCKLTWHLFQNENAWTAEVWLVLVMANWRQDIYLGVCPG